MTDQARFVKAFQRAWDKLERQQWIYGTLGRKNADGSFTFDVEGRPGFVYVTLRISVGAQTVVPARNDAGVPYSARLSVKLKLEYGNYVIHSKAGREQGGTVNPPSPPSGVPVHTHTHHSLTGFDTEDDHPQYLNVERGSTLYFDKAEYLTVSAGVADEGKPIVLNSLGLVDDSMLPSGSSAESIQDIVGAMFTGNTETNVSVTYDDSDGTIDVVVTTNTEEIQDIVGAMFTDSSSIDYTYDDVGNTISGAIITEFMQDLVGAMVSGGVETNIAVTYDDTNGRLDFVVSTNTEEVQDIVGAMWVDTSSIDYTYDDGAGTISGAIIDEYVQDVVGAMVTGNTETGITVTYDDSTGKLNFDAQTAGDARYVMLTTNQSVTGIKTFTDNPAIETATPTITFESPVQSIINGTQLFKLAVRGEDSSASLTETEIAYLKYIATGTWNDGNAPGMWLFGMLRQQTIPSINVYVEDLFALGNKGTLGIGTIDLEQVPTDYAAAQLGATGLIYIPKTVVGNVAIDGIWFVNNAYNDSGWKRRTAAAASAVQLINDTLVYYYAASSTIDSSITWIEMARMAAGKLILGGLTSVGASVLGIKAGSSSNDAAVGGGLFVSTASQGNTGTGEDELLIPGTPGFSVPANTLAVNNQSIWFEASGTGAANSNSKILKIRFGSAGTNLILSQAVDLGGGASTWVVRGRIFRTGAATQKAYADIQVNGVQTAAMVTTLNQTLSGAVNLRVTGEAVADNDIKIETFICGWDDANT